MKQQVDFSKGVRGQFSNPNAVFKLPVSPNEQVQGNWPAKADAKNMDLSDMVNDLPKRETEIIQAVA